MRFVGSLIVMGVADMGALFNGYDKAANYYVKLTGRDDGFYSHNAHQKLKILVSKTNPDEIRL